MSDLVHQMLERNARKYPDKLSIRCHVTNTELTWDEENKLANQAANLLLENGLTSNDNIAILFSNQVDFVISFFAISKIGGAVTPLNVRLTTNEIKQIVDSMDIKAIVYHPAFEGAIKDLALKTIPFSIKDQNSLTQFSNENLDFEISTEEIAEILLTSGTTGKPKGVMLSHRSVYQTAMMMSYEMGFHFSDRILQIMPLTHSAPLNLTLMGSTFTGALSILDNFDPEKILQHTENDQVTIFFGAPVAYLLALKVLENKVYDLTSMRKWLYGGAPMPSNYLKILRTKFPGDFVGLYGLTEAGPNGIALYPEEHEEHIGSAGKRATINTEFRVVDEQGFDVEVGVEGEVLIKTNSMMTGYYNNPEATEEAVVDGWLHTGDIGKFDEAGYLFIIDRKKDVIITGGVNIYPSEIESVILEIKGIQDTAVISKPHDEWGETTIAIVVRTGDSQVTEDDIRDYLKDKLAKYKIPREFVFASEVPRNASGKILKHQLREIYR